MAHHRVNAQLDAHPYRLIATPVGKSASIACAAIGSGSAWLPCESRHRIDPALEPYQAVYTLRYLPPYLPDLNPIEKMFSKLKALLRKTAKRTVESLWTDIGRRLDLFTLLECSNDFASCGYVVVPEEFDISLTCGAFLLKKAC